MHRSLRLPALIVVALLLLAQGSARVLLECASGSSAARSTSGTTHASASHAGHSAHRTHPGSREAAHEHGLPAAPASCESGDTGCDPAGKPAACALMAGCLTPATPTDPAHLTTVAVAHAWAAGRSLQPHWTDREPDTPPPRG